MTEEQTTEQQQTTDEQTTSEPVKSYSKEQYDGLKSNLVNQIGELKSQLDTFTKEREEQENAKLVENNQHKELLEKSQAQWQAERDELTKSIEQMKAEKQDLSLNNVLISNGITDEIQILGLKAKYATTEDAPDFAEWLTAQDLAPKETGKPSGSVGKVANGLKNITIPTSHADAKNMTREQKAEARNALREQARQGLIG